MKKQRKGFTLVELVIVIAILGILAAYAVPKYQGLVEQARSAEARAQLGTVRSALGIYYAKNHGQYPATLDGTIFAEGVVPTVEVTMSDSSVKSSNNVATSGTSDGKISQSDVTASNVGGWIYEVTADKTQCDVRINSTGSDTSVSPAIPWYTY
jgi:prepilin-type N-terminal cleavage/methylation domain-containing protein